MSEDEENQEEGQVQGQVHQQEADTRLIKLSYAFGHTPETLKFETGVALVPNGLRPGAFEIVTESHGTVDIVDVDNFRSVAELDEYVQHYEDSPPSDKLGHGVA